MSTAAVTTIAINALILVAVGAIGALWRGSTRRIEEITKEIKGVGEKGGFFRFLHSAGRLDERNNSADTDKRRVYIDIV